MTVGPARLLARTLDRATYEGYRLGYEAARDAAALIAERRGEAAVAEAIRTLRPLPARGEARQ